MQYLLDANVLIDANRDYYPIDRVPEFWDWLLEMANQGLVKIPVETYEEAVYPKPRNPSLLDYWLWANRDTIVFDESVETDLVQLITEQGYAADLTDDEIEKIGRDPFLIAYALADAEVRIVVTTEQSKPSRQRANRHVPDVCRDFGVRTANTFEFIRELNFSTNWRGN